MTDPPPLPPSLSREQRARIEAVLVRFDRHWTPEAFARFVPQSADGSLPPALADFIRIDLEHRWSIGHEAHVEDYLTQFPALASLPEVLCDVIHGEFQARESTQMPLELPELVQRFPALAEQVRQRIAASGNSRWSAGDVGQASIDTSRTDRDTHGGAATPIALPEQFGRYRILRQLGAGAMGAVYLAHDSQLDRQVALKTPSLGHGPGADELVERFYREARSAATLRHQNICPVHDVGQINGIHYISMAYIEGRPLSEYLATGKPIADRMSVTLIRKLAQSLAAAHEQGVIHRDLKPANVMIDKSREPVLTDFGLARRLASQDSTVTRSGAILGTPAYMSPEQVEGKAENIGPATDQYSLGVMFYEMLCRKLPFQGSIASVIGQIMTQAPPPPSQWRDDLSPQLEQICLRMMSKSAADRFNSMHQVSQRLQQWLESGTTESASHGLGSLALPAGERADTPTQTLPTIESKAPPPQHRSTSSGRSRWLIGAAAGGILLLLAIVLFVPTAQGTLRVEISDPRLRVQVSDELVAIKELKWEGKRRAKRHRLQLRLGDSAIPFDATSQQFSTANGRVKIMVDDIELSGNEFLVARNGTTVLKVEWLDGPAGALADKAGGAGGPSAERTAASPLEPWGSEKPQQVRRVEHRASLSYHAYFAALAPDGLTLAHRMEHELPCQLFPQADPAAVPTPPDMQSAIVLDYNGDGSQFATGHKDGTIRLWDAKTLKPVGQPWLTSADELLRWISLSADGGSVLAVTGNPCKLYAIDLTDRSRPAQTLTLDLHVKKSSFAATPDGRVLVAATFYGDGDPVRVWDIPEMKQRQTRYVPDKDDQPLIFNVDISSDGKRIAFGSKQGAAVVCDADTGRQLWSVAHGGRVSGVRFSPQGKLLATCGGPADSEEMHLWDMTTGEEWVRWRHPADSSRRAERLGAWITMMHFSSDGSRLLTAGVNAPICVWSLAPGEGVDAVVISRPPPRPELEPSGDRKIAEQIIPMGGAVGGIGPGNKYVYRVGRLPPGELSVTHVKYYGTNDRVTDDDLRVMLQLEDLTSVSFGELPELTLDGYRTLLACAKIKELHFVASTLDNEALAEVATMPLDSLTLWHTDVTNEGLAALSKLSILRQLTLGSSRKTHKYGKSFIDNAGLAHVANAPKLTKLAIYGPKFTDEAVETLAALQQLRQLTIGASLMTDGAISELRQRLPNCTIQDHRRNTELDDLESAAATE